MRNFYFSFGALLGIGCIMYGCAQKGSLTGGEKDRTPPKIIKAYPNNYTTNVDKREIEIEFNEYIKLKNKRDNILINPPIKNYEISGRRKTVQISIQDSLKENTTYNIQFGESIVDLTEGNAVQDFEYVFSTGDQLDSLQLKGKVVDAQTLDSFPKSKVLIYEDFSDSALYKKRPFYYTKANDKGVFKFDHLKKGKYQVYALKDLNDNLKYDGGENVAFRSEPLYISTDTVISQLLMFEQLLESPSIANAKMVNRGKVTLTFNQNLDTLNIKPLGNKNLSENFYWNFKDDKKSCLIWFPPSEEKTLEFAVELNRSFMDTAFIDRSDKYLSQSRQFDTGFNIQKIQKAVKPDHPLEITLDNPVKMADTNFMRVWKDSTPKNISGVRFTSPDRRQVELSGAFQVDSSYTIYLDSLAFEDIYGNRSLSQSGDFRIINSKELGSLEGSLVKDSTINSPVLLKLVNDKDKIIRSDRITKEKGNFQFEMLNPAKYRLKAIIDRNGNGFWNKGNLFDREMPERVVFYPGIINLKANWDIKNTKFKIPPP